MGDYLRVETIKWLNGAENRSSGSSDGLVQQLRIQQGFLAAAADC